MRILALATVLAISVALVAPAFGLGASAGYYAAGRNEVIVDAAGTHVTSALVLCHAVSGGRFYQGGNVVINASLRISPAGHFNFKGTLKAPGGTRSGGYVVLPMKISYSGSVKGKTIRVLFEDLDSGAKKLCRNTAVTLKYRGASPTPG